MISIELLSDLGKLILLKLRSITIDRAHCATSPISRLLKGSTVESGTFDKI